MFCFEVFKQYLIDRKTKSAVLVTGSSIRGFEAPGINLYSATKQFVSYISRAGNYELKKHGIDMMVFEPG